MRAGQASLPDALAECLDVVASYPWMLEECLHKYSHYRHELEPLLKLASAIESAVHEVQGPPLFLYVVAGGKAASPYRQAPSPLVARIWDRVDIGLRTMARRHTVAMRSALLSLFALMAVSGWALVMGSTLLVSVLLPSFQPLWLALSVGLLPWLFLAMAVSSADRWLILFACSAPAPGVKVPLRLRRRRPWGVLRDLWNSPNLGMRLACRLSVWTLVRVVGLALALGWLLPIASVGLNR